MSSHPQRGDVYWVDFDPVQGSEQGGRRPAVVISLNSFNRAMPVVAVAAITSKVKPSKICVLLPAGQPLPLESQVMPFQVRTIDQNRLEKFVGRLSAAQIVDLEQKMRLCWGL